MEENKNNILQVMGFDKVQLPQFKEYINKQKEVVYFGEDNLFPQYLHSLLAKSPLHSSITTQKARMTGGYGFLKTNIQPSTQMFLDNYRNEYNLDEILYRVAYDLEVYGAFAINPVWSKDRKSITEINYIDVSKLRVQAPDEEHKYPQIENYWISDGWENTRKYPAVLYQGFSTRSKKRSQQIYYVKDQRAGQEYYGVPEYLSAIRWMEIDWLVGDFHMNNINNGFAPSYIVSLPFMGGSDEERASLAQRMKIDLEGSTNAGRWFLNYAMEDGQTTQFEPIEMNNSDGRFMILKDGSQESILLAHRVTHPVLFIGDIMSPGSLGGKSEILEALELFQNAYITPKQNILEKVFNRLARINGITDNLIVKRYSEEFRKVDTSLKDTLDVLTSNNQETLSIEQKYWILTANGYNPEVAAKITGYTDGVNQKEISKKPPVQAPAVAEKPVDKKISNSYGYTTEY